MFFLLLKLQKQKYEKQLSKTFIMSYDVVKLSKYSVVLMCLNRYYIFSPILKCSIHKAILRESHVICWYLDS